MKKNDKWKDKICLLNNAFTLVELLGVLIILAVIALITFPIVDSVIKNGREESYNRTVESIIEAASNYSTVGDLGYSTEKKALYLEDIKRYGLLDQSIINPVTEEEMAGCVWYSWDPVYNQYNFEYDSECEIEETEPTINLSYNSSLINSNGWAKENVAVTLSGNGEIKYCIDSEECEPTTVVNGNYTQFISAEGTNYLCALSNNSLGTTDKKCVTIKLDKTAPNIEGVGDKIAQKGEVVDLTTGVSFNDALSQIDGTLTITPSTVDTSTVGTKQVVYRVQDMAGNVREVVRNIIVDAEAPNIVFNLVDSSVINSNGWANKNFYVRATITDNSGTGIKSASSCTTNGSGECDANVSFSGTTKDFLISTEGNNRACIQVTDNNNKTTKVCSDTYNLDKTAPVAGTATFTGTAGTNGWYRSNVTVNVINGTDGLSGHSTTTSSVSSITSNTSGQTVTITTTDLAGNTSSRDYTIKMDKTIPTLDISATDASYHYGDRVIITATASDSNMVGTGTLTYSYYYKLSTASEYTLGYTGTNTSYTVDGLTIGTSLNIKVVVTDAAGNSITKETTGGTSCFTAGTLVYTNEGYRSIEEIEVGELVYAIDLETNELILKPVLSKFVGMSNEIYHIKVNDEIIEVTPKHQFYVIDKGWVRAYDLEVGDLLTSEIGNLPIRSIELEKLNEPVTVYNLEVEGLHTYLVTKYSILVHNVGSRI